MTDLEYLEFTLTQYGKRVYSKYNAPQGATNVYIGRPSILGNPFLTGANKTWDDRMDNCIKFRDYIFDEIIKKKNPKIINEVRKLTDCNVICWCSNGTCSVAEGAKYCHGHTLLYACDYLHGRHLTR